MRFLATLWLSACLAPDPGSSSSASGTATPSGGDEGTVALTLAVWDADGACWAARVVDRPSEYWPGPNGDCGDVQDTGVPHYFTLGTADGDCVAWYRHSACSTAADPWFTDCITVAGCCGRAGLLEPVCAPASGS